MMAKYVTITKVESMSRAGVRYRIQMKGDSGHLNLFLPCLQIPEERNRGRVVKAHEHGREDGRCREAPGEGQGVPRTPRGN
jgi:hypothetical protein